MMTPGRDSARRRPFMHHASCIQIVLAPANGASIAGKAPGGGRCHDIDRSGTHQRRIHLSQHLGDLRVAGICVAPAEVLATHLDGSAWPKAHYRWFGFAEDCRDAVHAPRAAAAGFERSGCAACPPRLPSGAEVAGFSVPVRWADTHPPQFFHQESKCLNISGFDVPALERRTSYQDSARRDHLQSGRQRSLARKRTPRRNCSSWSAVRVPLTFTSMFRKMRGGGHDALAISPSLVSSSSPRCGNQAPTG